MKFSCPKEKILRGVQIVQKAISSKTTLPILTGIYLEAKDNRLILRATDLETAIEYSFSLEIEQPGRIVLPSRYFGDLVRRLPNMDILIEQIEEINSVMIRYGHSEIQLNGMDAEEFPILPEIKNKHKLEIEPLLFTNMIKQVSIASSTDISRPIFTGILLETENDVLNMIATDTHRLAFRKGKLNLKLDNENKVSLIIPGRTLIELSRLLETEDEIIEIHIGDNQVLFKIENLIITTRIIEGQFPNYQQVIPQDQSTRIKINTKNLLEAIERATLLSKDEVKARSNVIKIKTEGNTLIIDSRSPEVGNIHEEIPIYLEGDTIEIAFNGRYLIDVLKVIDSEDVYFDLTGSLNPGILKPGDNENYLYLVLPIRTTI